MASEFFGLSLRRQNPKGKLNISKRLSGFSSRSQFRKISSSEWVNSTSEWKLLKEDNMKFLPNCLWFAIGTRDEAILTQRNLFLDDLFVLLGILRSNAASNKHEEVGPVVWREFLPQAAFPKIPHENVSGLVIERQLRFEVCEVGIKLFS